MMSRLGSDVLGFKRFMLRYDVLRLYKDIFRTIRRVDDEYYRDFLRDQARMEFRNQIKESNAREISLLVAQGRKRLDEMRAMMGMATNGADDAQTPKPKPQGSR